MKNPSLILASASPRRRDLLNQLGIAHRVEPADIDETPYPGEPPADYVIRMATEKAEAVRSRFDGYGGILAADTTVVLDGSMLGKPADETEAAGMLHRLSGRTHEVMSAVALLTPDGKSRSALNVSRVAFAPLDDEWIRAYCATGEPLDKAGAYGVQGRAAARIRHLEGSFHCVMGLPLYETTGLLHAAGWDLRPGVNPE
ncbi:Maf family protein [Elongatibacter sediminis]|uniref:dTTP/UTP pyrophosphatase n=1 Tax=Elongatibacter sediminis TaxID=3119006 RepID=A0AAW9RFB7_9GAMM